MKKVFLILLVVVLFCGCNGKDYNINLEFDGEYMPLSIYDKSVTSSESGETIPGAIVEVKNESNQNAQLYSDKAGLNPISNPVTADANGRVTFYAEVGRYNITATSTEGVVTYDDVVINDVLGAELTPDKITLDITDPNHYIELVNSSTDTRYVITGKPGSEPGGYMKIQNDPSSLGGGSLTLSNENDWASGVDLGAYAILDAKGETGIGAELILNGSNTPENQSAAILISPTENYKVKKGTELKEIAEEDDILNLQTQITALGNPTGFAPFPVDYSNLNQPYVLSVSDVGKHLSFFQSGMPNTLTLDFGINGADLSPGDSIKMTLPLDMTWINSSGLFISGFSWFADGFFQGNTFQSQQATVGRATWIFYFINGVWEAQVLSPVSILYANIPYTAT